MFILFTLWFIVTVNHIINLIYINKKSTPETIKYSVIIPCRNEERNIAQCLDSCLKNIEFINEIIVVNDNSEDDTKNILNKYSENFPNTKVINLDSKPENWIGKNYACFTGAKESDSDFLLFLDADVRILSLENLNFNNEYSLTFIFPKHITITSGEKILIPFRIIFLGIFILPLYLMNFRLLGKPVWANAYGYFLAVNKKDYFDIGGHEMIKDKIIEDIELAKLFAANNYKIRGIKGQNIAEIRMYENFSESWNGFLKNYYYNFGKSVINLLLLWIIILSYFAFPVIVKLTDNNWGSIFLGINIIFYLNYVYFTYGKLEIKDTFLSIVGIPFNLLCSFQSFYKGITKKSFTWKGREIM